MKTFKKIISISFIFGIAVISCQKDNDFVTETNKFSPVQAKRKLETQFEQIPFSSLLKSTNFSEKQEFKDGGFVQVASQFFPTKIVGDQRWITANYTTPITGQTFNNGNTIHHSYEAAISLNGSPTQMNMYAPANLTETSTWRIPSQDDMEHLYQMLQGDLESEKNGLNLVSTGMIQWDEVSDPDNATHVNPSLSIFWNSDFHEPTEHNFGTWHLYAHDTVNYAYLFEYQIPYPYAPIRLVQNVEPID